MGRSRRNTLLSREESLTARPVKLALAQKPEIDGGGLRLTVNLPRPRWHRWLGGTGRIKRSFDLDTFGREVYDMCGGGRNVRTMIESFASRHNLSIAEAETSVTKFLNTLMSRGLVGMDVKPRENCE